MITHWDELESQRRERGHIAAEWTSLSGAHSDMVGVTRIRVDPGMWATPLHLEGVRGGDLLRPRRRRRLRPGRGRRARGYAVAAGDCLVHRALEHAHTLQGGPNGIDVLAFGQRSYAANTLLPRAGVSWLGSTWVLQGAPDDHPWAREAAAGPPEVGELLPHPERIVNVADVPVRERHRTTVGSDWRDLGRAAGSERTGLRHVTVAPGKLSDPPHCHSAEEEIFVVLDGEGTLELLPGARTAGGRRRAVDARVRAGHDRLSPSGHRRRARVPRRRRRPHAPRLRAARARTTSSTTRVLARCPCAASA